MSDGNFCAHCGALIYYGPHLCYGQSSQTVPVQHPHTTMVTRDAGLEIQGPVFQQVMDELAALRARHEKLREGCKALVEVWRDTANYGTDPDKSAAERLLFDTVHAHADELNALLEDE